MLTRETVGTAIQLALFGTVWAMAVVTESYCGAKLWADAGSAEARGPRSARWRIPAVLVLLALFQTAVLVPFACLSLPAHKADPLTCFGGSWFLLFACGYGAFLWVAGPLTVFVFTAQRLGWSGKDGQPARLPLGAKLLLLPWVLILIEGAAYWVWVYSGN